MKRKRPENREGGTSEQLKRLSVIVGICAVLLIIALIVADKQSTKNANAEAVDLVLASLTDASKLLPIYRSVIRMDHIATGRLHGGIAVLVEDMAYWVQKGVVYAASGLAKIRSRDIDYAPDPRVTWYSVVEAVDRGP